MKVLMLTFVTALVTTTVCQAAGPFVPLTIGSIVSENGMKIEISSTGEVTSTQDGKTRLLTTLSQRQLDSFNEDQHALNVGATLKPAMGASSVCSDMSATTFSARSPTSKMQVVGTTIDCRDMIPADASRQSENLRKVLKTINGLAAVQIVKN